MMGIWKATKARVDVHFAILDRAIELALADPNDVSDALYPLWKDLVVAVSKAGYVEEPKQHDSAAEISAATNLPKWSKLTEPQKQLLFDLDCPGKMRVRGPKLAVANSLQRHGLALLESTDSRNYFASITPAGKALLDWDECDNWG